AQVFGQDALALCRAAWAADTPVWIREIEAVGLLRQILVQTYYLHTDTRGREVIKKRDADDEGVPPGKLRLASPYDPDARWAAKGEDLVLDGLQGPPHRYLRHSRRSRSRSCGPSGAEPDHGRVHHRRHR